MELESLDGRVSHELLGIRRYLIEVVSSGIQGSQHSGESIGMTRREADDVIVGITGSFCNGGWMPADEQRLDVVACKECREVVLCGGNFVQGALEITAGMGVHAARARMDVNVNRLHETFFRSTSS